MKDRRRPNQHDLFEDGRVIAAASAYYSEEGDRNGLDLHLFTRGPRGGEYTIWKGTLADARKHARLLERAADAAEAQMPRRASWAKREIQKAVSEDRPV